MNYKGYIIKPTPENLRELDEILAGNVPNSNDKDKNDSKQPRTIITL